MVTLQHPLIFIAGVILIFIFTLWSYRYTIPPVSRLLRRFLIFLRFISLMLLLGLLFEPILLVKTTKKLHSTLALLIDNSASMQIKEEGRMRGERIKNMVLSPEIQRLRKNHPILFYSFSDSLHPLEFEQLEQLKFNGLITDFSKSLRMLHDLSGDVFIGSGLIMTDGSYNYGENPLRIGETFLFPLHTIHVGRAQRYPDLVVSHVLTNEISYVDHQVVVRVTVRGPGFEGQRVSLTLKNGDKTLDMKTVLIPAQGMERTEELHFIPFKIVR